VTPCKVVVGYQPENRGSMDLWNVGILLQHGRPRHETPSLENLKTRLVNALFPKRRRH